MDVRFKPRMSKEEVQQIIDSRLAILLEKELLQENVPLQNSGSGNVDSSQSKPRTI